MNPVNLKALPGAWKRFRFFWRNIRSYNLIKRWLNIKLAKQLLFWMMDHENGLSNKNFKYTSSFLKCTRKNMKWDSKTTNKPNLNQWKDKMHMLISGVFPGWFLVWSSVVSEQFYDICQLLSNVNLIKKILMMANILSIRLVIAIHFACNSFLKRNGSEFENLEEYKLVTRKN